MHSNRPSLFAIAARAGLRWSGRRLLACTVLAVWAAAAWIAPATAATRDYYFEQLGSERGLAQNTITAMLQDSQGFIWVATQGGLHRYDGHRYVAYRHDPRDPTSLPDSYITALALEDGQSLWVGSYSEYVVRLDLRSGRIERYSLPDGSPQAAHHVLALLPQGDRLWVGTAAGLERFDPGSGRHEPLLALPASRSRAQPRQQLLSAEDGGVWYGTPIGLFHVDQRGRSARIGDASAIHSLLRDSQGALWVGRSDGLFRLQPNPQGGELVRVWPAKGSQPRPADVVALAEAPDHRLWLALAGHGLLRLDPDTGQAKALHETPGLQSGLPEDSINALLVDRGGMLWVGGVYRGVAVTDPRGTPFRYVLDLLSGTRRNVVSDDSVRAVLERSPGILWVATDNARLLRYDLAADRFDDWTARLPPLPPDARARRVLGMAPATNGRIWLASSRGLLRLDPAAGAIEPIDLGRYNNASLRTVMVDDDGGVWLGSMTAGALRYLPGSGELTHYGAGDSPSQLAHPTVHALLQDNRGRIWIGTSGGVAVLDPDSGRMRHFSHSPNGNGGLAGHVVRALHQSANGTIWIGTHTGLSEVVRSADGRIGFARSLAATLDERPMPAVYSISESAGGRLWLGTDAGIVAFDPQLGRARFYGLADGLQDLEFNGGAVTTLHDGRQVFGGVRGLNLFDPARVVDSVYSAPVMLLAARVGADAPSDAGVLWQPTQLSLPAGAALLRLRIGALDFAPNANLHYRYRLDGFDQGWIDNGTQSDITYTRLPPGHYLFRAQAANRDGIWGGAELRIPIHVAAPWWRHPLVLAGVVLILLVLLAIGIWRWLRQRRIEQGYFAQIREREERLKLALWASGEQFWDYDLSGRELHRMRVDDHSSDTPDVGVHTDIDDNHEIHPDDLPRVRNLLRQHLRGEAALFLSEHRVRRPDGQWSWVRARGRVVERDNAGIAVRVAGTARDITASRSAERERRISSEVLRSMAEAVAVFDRDFVFISVNPAFTRMTGYSDHEVIGRSTSLLDSLQHDPDFYHQMRDELQRSGRWSGEVWQQRKDGNEFLCWLQASAVLDAHGQRMHYVAVLGDITDQKRAEQELRYLANYDPLTSLPNRTLLSERLSRAIVRARRANQKIAVLFLDLDRFKDINDSLGHAAGDRILRAAAARLQETVGMQHTVARLGGDEFTVVLEHVESAEQAEDVARQIIVAFQTPLDFDQRQDIAISPSIGISLYPDHAQVPTDLIKHADTAMYQAKARGRRTFMRYHEAMDVDLRRRATISAALRKVLDRNELTLAFQPRLSLSSGRITGVEALLRWRSEEHGDIDPTQFIPLAEETGLILDIGEWALREACSKLQQWRRHEGLDHLSMAVNVSALQLLRGDLPRVVARVLADTDIPAARFELELTESVIMANAEQTGATLQAFRQLGVGLAIDDFGTGYSSLAYLKRLPITALKIDKEFIDDLTRDPDDEAITTAVIAMAHSLGLCVVAEGVETLAQAQFLREHGCDEIQGYWLARPLTADACLHFLQTWNVDALAVDKV